MPLAPIRIDVTDVATRVPTNSLAILVEPLYGSVAVALALDAGWESVEIAPDLPEGRRIPLVSYDVPPPANAPTDANGERRCRVRCTDLVVMLDRLATPIVARGVVLGAPICARPLAARLSSRALPANVALVAVPSTSLTDRRDVSSDSWWAAGMIARVLLDELDSAYEPRLSDAGGIAVTLAQGAEDPAQELGRGLRWFRHLDYGGTTDDLRIASAIDQCPVVPVVRRDPRTGAWIAHRLAPADLATSPPAAT